MAAKIKNKIVYKSSTPGSGKTQRILAVIPATTQQTGLEFNLIGYEATDSEKSRIEGKYGTNSPLPGVPYVVEGGDGKNYVMIGYFNNYNNYQSFNNGTNPDDPNYRNTTSWDRETTPDVGGITTDEITQDIFANQSKYSKFFALTPDPGEQPPAVPAVPTEQPVTPVLPQQVPGPGDPAPPAQVPGPPPAADGAPKPEPEPTSVPIPPAAPRAEVKKQYLSYPIKMRKEQDKIRFQAVQLAGRTTDEDNEKLNSNTQAFQFRFGERRFTAVDKYVLLPIQSSITDQNSVDWGPDSINAIDSALYYKSLGFMETQSGEMGAQIQGFLGGIMTEFKRKKGYFQKYLAGQAAGNANVVSRTDGVILNPNMELLFTGPQLRPFSFQFKMSARDSDEAKEIKEIIKYFKQNMAVNGEIEGGFFLKSPNVFRISYLKWFDEEKDNNGKVTRAGGYRDHPGLNLIHPYSEAKDNLTKACALTNCSVDYTPLGSYATYNDGTMVSYNISLQFQDLTPIYASDYKDHPIGY